LVGRIASEWYRNDNGLDVFQAKEVSIGGLLNRDLLMQFSHIVRYYIALKEYTSSYDKILIPDTSAKSLKMAATLFPNEVEFYIGNGNNNDHITSSPNRGDVINMPIYGVLSTFLRLLQFPFSRYLRNKVLVFNDWTFRELNNHNCLNINRFNPLKTFCLRHGSKYIRLAESIFPKKLNNTVVKSNIRRELFKFDIDNSMLDDLVKILSNTIANEYTEFRKVLINIYCTYLELFDKYKPSMIVVSSYSTSYSQAILGIAKSRDIPTFYIQDGYAVYLDKYFLPKNTNNNDYKINYFAAMGSYSNNLLKDVLDGDINFIKILPPVISTHSNIDNNKIHTKYAIVMFPYPFLHSPYGRRDKKYKYVIDVVDALESLGYENINIKIKMKMGFETYRTQEDELMRNLLNKNDYSDVEMIFGEFSDCLKNAELVVGYMGTGVVESIYRKVPFYIYEPKSFGMTNDFINKSVFIKNSQISRDLNHLKESISKCTSVSLDLNKIFDGVDIGDIDFSKMAQDFASQRHKLDIESN
jgi:hypothetical protein